MTCSLMKTAANLCLIEQRKEIDDDPLELILKTNNEKA